MSKGIIRISADAEQIIRNVHKFCNAEKENGMQISLKAPLKRTHAMTGLSESTVLKVIAETDRQPSTTRGNRSKKLTLDDFDMAVVRRTVSNMYRDKKILPTLNNIQTELKSSIGYRGSKTHLRSIMKRLGFSYRRCKSNRKVLMERTDVVLHRVRYLKQIKRLREEGRPIFYCDETFVHSHHSVSKCWQNSESGLHVPFSKGERMIILHYGNENGFVDGAELVFKARTSSGDYHNEMNKENFMRWLSEKLIPNLPPKSVLVLDNAPYHNVQEDRCPTMSSRKTDIQEWLRCHGIAFNEELTKTHLIQICRKHAQAPSYSVDRVLAHHGHLVLRLPPYHPDLNPIELIWATLKGYVARRNINFKLADVKRLISEGLQSVTADVWSRCCTHVKEQERQYWTENIGVAKDQDPVIISLESDDSDCNSYGETSDTDTADEAEGFAETTDTACGETTDTAPGETTDTAPGETTDTASGDTTDTADDV